MTVVTRFAPSPTGSLHLGSARTALFNWLYARHHNGRYLLRIEDTDRSRSTPEAVAKIIDGLKWLGLGWDGDISYQSQHATRHTEVANTLLKKGNAYYCFATPEELLDMRQKARADRRPIRYDGRWRNRDPQEGPVGVKPVIRLKAPQTGVTIVFDKVQGQVRIENMQLDDMVLLRSDGSPTYMLSVVVDDHDEGITDIIRGDDHLTNAARQIQLYNALGWEVPNFGHIPLIYGTDGAKLSKRHGATGVGEYKNLGYLPDALFNYLLRMGWGHGDEEVINRANAINWFKLNNVRQAPARFDLMKLDNLNAHYLRAVPESELLTKVIQRIKFKLERSISNTEQLRVSKGLEQLKKRAKTLQILAENATFYVEAPTFPLQNSKADNCLKNGAESNLLKVQEIFLQLESWSAESLENELRSLAKLLNISLGELIQPLRAALTGSNISPGIFEILQILGMHESLSRIDRALKSIK